MTVEDLEKVVKTLVSKGHNISIKSIERTFGNTNVTLYFVHYIIEDFAFCPYYDDTVIIYYKGRKFEIINASSLKLLLEKLYKEQEIEKDNKVAEEILSIINN